MPIPRDKMLGVWWSGAEPDVVPAGEKSTGYKALLLQHPAGKFSSIHADVAKACRRHQGQERSPNLKMQLQAKEGQVLYNRGLINSMLGVEAIRTAHEEVRQQAAHRRARSVGALKTLSCQPLASKSLALRACLQPLKFTCHRSPGCRRQARVHQWDGKAWKIISGYVHGRTVACLTRWSRKPQPSTQPKRRSHRATARKRAECY